MVDRTSHIGQQIGDFLLLHRLGGGSFGEVYLGEHVQTRAQAAVKVLQTRLTRSDELKEFMNEARTFRLRHPHIIKLLDFGIVTNGVPYLIMEYACHGTLRDIHPKGTQVPLSIVHSYVTPLASALQYAHDQQLIHRDVKPENMLLGAHHNVLLSDFGIAAVAHSSSSLNTQEDISGTLPYMAPEQLQGKPRPASDQYSLGIVVYEWLTGTRPFKGTTIEIAMQHYMTPPPPLRELVSMLSADVEQVVLTALAKEPKQRFESIAAFATALEQACRKRNAFSRVMLLPPALSSPPLPAAPPRAAEPVEKMSIILNESSPVSKPQKMEYPSPFSKTKEELLLPLSLEHVSIPPSRSIFSSHLSRLLFIGLACLSLIGGTLFAIRGSSFHTSASPIQLHSLTATQTSRLLYTAGSGVGWSGWNGTSEWYVSSGSLLSKGIDQSISTQPTIIAPYSVRSTNNYVIQAHVRIVGGTEGCFFLTFRGSLTATEWSGYKVAVCTKLHNVDIQGSFGNVLKHTNFVPGDGYHVYRIEVRGSSILCYIDDVLHVQIEDTSVPVGSQIGMKTWFGQIEVSGFEIMNV